MLPKVPLYDFTDMPRFELKQFGDVTLSKAKRKQFSDFSYIFGRQLGAAMSFAVCGWFPKDIITVKKIFGVSAIFQVAVSVVCLNAVLVIDLLFARNWLKKNFGYEFVRSVSAFDVFSTEADLRITMPSDSGHNESHLFSPRRNFSAEASEIRDAIESFVIRNWLPDFGGVIRLVGHNLRLSVDCVLAAVSALTLSAVNYFYRFLGLEERQML
jgi:hypothetical protein